MSSNGTPPHGRRAPSRYTAAFRRETACVLVVDADAAGAVALTEQIMEAGHPAVVAGNAAEALHLAQGVLDAKLVLIDACLPDDGAGQLVRAFAGLPMQIALLVKDREGAQRASSFADVQLLRVPVEKRELARLMGD